MERLQTEMERLQTEVEQKEHARSKLEEKAKPQEDDGKKRLREIMVDEDARHAKAKRQIQDGTKEKRDEQARKEAAGKGFVEGTTVYLKDGGYSSCSTREFTVEYCILAISDNQGEVWADVQKKRQIDPDMDYGFVMRPLSALTLAAPGPLVEESINEMARS